MTISARNRLINNNVDMFVLSNIILNVKKKYIFESKKYSGCRLDHRPRRHYYLQISLRKLKFSKTFSYGAQVKFFLWGRKSRDTVPLN